ncbi:serine/threonine protein kinase [Scheffersomyces xylosifermentans]|uniref:serine/threonine protein kinase n=1 Tax=Scheffersomyces xylosifermentans TaxID=1304137 RepID=UPI00315D39E9
MEQINTSDEFQQYESGIALLYNRYQYVSKIQDGSFGRVSLALDTFTNTKVSVKAIPVLDGNASKSTKDIAYNEISILQSLSSNSTARGDFDNSNVCKLIDSFEVSNYVILVLEYCSKGDLYDLIHERALTISEILRLSKQLHNAVSYSHSIGIYHRDIKPENILIDENDNFKLCDWGLATRTRENDEFNVGTEKYMAPECFLKNSNDEYIISKYDCKYSDYWSFGITLIASIFGTSPFKPTKKSDSKNNTESIQSDSNFRNFVNYNNPHILYDIYSSMNQNCFQIFMNLLKVGSDEDDLATFNAKVRSRSLSKFINDLETNWIYGFTIDDEDKFYDTNCKESDEAVFDMDHDDLEFMKQSYTTITSDDDSEGVYKKEEDIAEEEEGEDEFQFMKVPSLIESSMKSTKSWCDLDDDDDFEFDLEMEDLFQQLKVSSEEPEQDFSSSSSQNLQNGSIITTADDITGFPSATGGAKAVGKSKSDDQIRIIEHELFMDNTRDINWFEY